MMIPPQTDLSISSRNPHPLFDQNTAKTQCTSFRPSAFQNASTPIMNTPSSKRSQKVLNVHTSHTSILRPRLPRYPPQAIANLCWSLGRLTSRPDLVASFGRAAAREAMVRMNDFSWQVRSGGSKRSETWTEEVNGSWWIHDSLKI